MAGTNFVTIKNSLAGGEFSPSLFGRTDFETWSSGMSTCRNFITNYRGGVFSRPGLAYVGTCKQSGTLPPPRDIPFQFSLYQGYVLEFGNLYLRVKFNGAYVTESPINLTGVSNLAVFTSAAPHGLSIGDWVYDVGNNDFSGLAWIVKTVPTASTFTVESLFGQTISVANVSSGGTVARIYTAVSPYADDDLPYLKYTQSADTMTLTCVNSQTGTEYPPYSLVRNSDTNWVFTVDVMAADIAAPTGLTGTAQSSSLQSTWYAYVVTSVDAETGEESVASEPVYIFNNDIAVNAGSNTISWDAVAGAGSYNVYGAIPSYQQQPPVSSLFGFVGTALGSSFVDTNIIPDMTTVPPVHNNPFARGRVTDVVITAGGSNYSPSTVGYSVTTGTGTGFDGEPVVAGGEVIGFLIKNKGRNYVSGNTIAFTDSGGGRATGYFNFTTNPGNKTTLLINGVLLAFSTDVYNPLYDTQCPVESTLALTLQSLAGVLNSSPHLSWNVASYTATATRLNITYKTPGSVGNAYTLANVDVVGATVSGATLTGGGTAGTGATGTLTIGPVTGTYPSVPAYFQQRRVYANTRNKPDTYWMSQPGLYSNFDYSIPVTDSDSIEGAPWAQQINGIQSMVPMPGGLVVLTGNGVWQVKGDGQNSAITPSNQISIPQAYNGCHDLVPPIVINQNILYVQSKGSIIRNLEYNFYNNIYTGTDLTVLSSHLFVDNQITQWAYAEEPYKLVWALRSDGILLCLTHLKEQKVNAWTRHDTNGQFVSVCSVTEPLDTNLSDVLLAPYTDATYTIVKRYNQQHDVWMYYSERFNNRVWSNIEETFAADSGLSTELTYPSATLSAAASEGEEIEFTASSSIFTLANEGDIIRMGGGKAEITNYVSGTVVECTILEPIVQTIPDNVDDIPLPAPSGTWSIATPVESVRALNHLEGEEVCILADGSVVPNVRVVTGVVQLPYPATKVVVGLPYVCQGQTLYVDLPNDGGQTTQNRRKNISSVGLIVEQTRGLQIGANQIDQSTQSNSPNNIVWTNMNEVKDRTAQINAGTAVPMFTGQYFKNVTSGWSVNGQVAFQQVYPLPASVNSIITYWILGDQN